MSVGISLCNKAKLLSDTRSSEVQEYKSIEDADKVFECATNTNFSGSRTDVTPTACLPVIHYITQAELFPRAATSDDERQFRVILQTIMPEKAPAIVSVINRIAREEDSFMVEGLMWDGTIVNLELVGRYRRGGKAQLRWYAHPDEVPFGWEPGSKRWLRHAGDLPVVNTKRCEFYRIDFFA